MGLPVRGPHPDAKGYPVNCRPLSIAGAYQVDIEALGDERGLFARTYCAAEFVALGIELPIAQCSISYNRDRYTLRGMHWQRPPHPETKLVRCTAGQVWDCLLDLRPDSPTFKQWTAVELSAENRRAVLIPPECAHGFITLTPNTELFYMMSTPYAPESAMGVRWNDPAFNIEWPANPEVLSAKDQSWPDFT